MAELAAELVVDNNNASANDSLRRCTETARLALGGESPRLYDGIFISDLLNPDENSKVSTAEIFGPVVCVYDCADIDEAVRRANSLDVAFQASIFSNDLSETISSFSNLDATAVMINDHTAFRVDWMPFAGRRQSGYGTGGIGYTMHDMTQDKMAVIKL